MKHPCRLFVVLWLAWPLSVGAQSVPAPDANPRITHSAFVSPTRQVPGVKVSGNLQRPDFSGEWILDRQGSTLHKDFASLQSGTVRIVHKEPQFAFQRTFVVAGQPRDLSYDMKTDGSQQRTERQGVTTVSTMKWDGTALILSQTISLPQGGTVTNMVRYELLEQGRILRATEDLSGPQTQHHNIWLFERR